MKAQGKIVLLMSFAMLPVGLRAQEPSSQVPEDQQISADQPLSPPPILNGQGPSLAFQSEETRTNYLLGGISLTGAFTDNAFLTNNNTVSDSSFAVLPHISFSQSTPRMNWDMGFAAGLIVDQQLRGENQFSKSFLLDLSYRLSEHVNLRLSDTFTDTTGLFSLLSPEASRSLGTVEQSNNSLLVPPLQRTLANAALAELGYQFSPTSMVGLRGTVSILNYPDSSQNAQFGPLYNTQTYLVEPFYNHEISLSKWVGVTLRLQRFDIEPSISRTDTATLLLYYAIQPGAGVTLSFFAGPEYYNTPRISDTATAQGLFPGQMWTSAEGATITWQGKRTSASATFSRQLSDGGGLSSAVTLQTVSASLRHQLSQHQAVYLDFTDAVNIPVEQGYRLTGLRGLFRFEQRLSNNLVFEAGYGRLQQDLPISHNTMATANTAWVSASYSFSRAMGSSSVRQLPKYPGRWP
jgi:hypothetical protein